MSGGAGGIGGAAGPLGWGANGGAGGLVMESCRRAPEAAAACCGWRMASGQAATAEPTAEAGARKMETATRCA